MTENPPDSDNAGQQDRITSSAAARCSGCGIWPAEVTHVCPSPLMAPTATPTVRTLYNVRVTRADGVVIFDGSVTDDDHFEMKQTAGRSTKVLLSATAAIEGLTR